MEQMFDNLTLSVSQIIFAWIGPFLENLNKRLKVLSYWILRKKLNNAFRSSKKKRIMRDNLENRAPCNCKLYVSVYWTIPVFISLMIPFFNFLVLRRHTRRVWSVEPWFPFQPVPKFDKSDWLIPNLVTVQFSGNFMNQKLYIQICV